MDKQTERWTINRKVDEQKKGKRTTERWTHKQKGGRTNRKVDEQTERWTKNRKVNEQTERWTHKQKRKLDRLKENQTNRQIILDFEVAGSLRDLNEVW